MNVSALVNDLMQFHNAGVPEVRESVDLPVDSLLSLAILEIFLVIGLDCYHMLGLFMGCTPHNCKSTLADLKIYLKFV